MNSSINIILIFFLLISSPINADIFLREDITTTPDINHFSMKEINTPQKNEYAVDSWFEDNGKPPHIILLSTWRSGWEPEKL